MLSKQTYGFKDVLVLMKHRLSFTVAISALVGWFLYDPSVQPQMFLLFFGTFLLAGGSSAMNQYQECGLDRYMRRTRNRPIPSGIMMPQQAFAIALLLMASGTIILLFAGVVPAVLGILNAVIYNLVYTVLKTKTQYAVLPGAVVGAIPPLMGWTAAGGALVEPRIIYFAVFMFLWQMPHFWLLIIKYGKEYEEAGFTSLARTLDVKRIKALVFFWAVTTTLYLFAFPLFFTQTPLLIFALLLMLNVAFIYGFYRFLFTYDDEKSTLKAFLLINSYALLVMVLFVVNSFLA
jgi:heme o synthase